MNTSTRNPYNTVARDDFPSMIDVERYGQRSHHFDDIIARTNEHFWNPDDPAYLDYQEPMPPDVSIVPFEMVPELQSAVADKLNEQQQIELANASIHWGISNILHGEQGALSLSTSLCDLFIDPGAQEYAANQVREEARHVHGFTNYMRARFGGQVLPVGETVGGLLNDLVKSDVIYKKLIGMQMLVEGLAMGAFATLHVKSHDPLLRRLCQLTMTDEAFHHKFGKIWAQAALSQVNEAEHNQIEDWALECFNMLLFNLINPQQKRVIYAKFGLDWEWVQAAVLEVFTDAERRRLMTESTDIFRTLIKTLLKAGIITERTRPFYAAWVDLEELAREGDHMVGDDIAEEGIIYLKEINAGKRRIVRKVA